jgi:hypothetical protein
MSGADNKLVPQWETSNNLELVLELENRLGRELARESALKLVYSKRASRLVWKLVLLLVELWGWRLASRLVWKLVLLLVELWEWRLASMLEWQMV